MRVEAYFCPSCRLSASVVGPEAEHPGITLAKVKDHHAENSPDCKGDPNQIIVGAGPMEEAQ